VRGLTTDRDDSWRPRVSSNSSRFGLRGGWGTVRFGSMKTPYDTVNGVFGNTPTFTSSILDSESVWGNGSSDGKGGAATGERIGGKPEGFLAGLCHNF
jgi:predicted porin